MEIVTKLDTFNKTFNAGSILTGTININNKEKLVTDFSQLNAFINVIIIII